MFIKTGEKNAINLFFIWQDIQLRWFQKRILHRILATNPHTIQRWFFGDRNIQFWDIHSFDFIEIAIVYGGYDINCYFKMKEIYVFCPYIIDSYQITWNLIHFRSGYCLWVPMKTCWFIEKKTQANDFKNRKCPVLHVAQFFFFTKLLTTDI